MDFFDIYRKYLTEAYTEKFPEEPEVAKNHVEFDIEDSKEDPSVRALLEYIDLKIKGEI